MEINKDELNTVLNQVVTLSLQIRTATDSETSAQYRARLNEVLDSLSGDDIWEVRTILLRAGITAEAVFDRKHNIEVQTGEISNPL